MKGVVYRDTTKAGSHLLRLQAPRARLRRGDRARGRSSTRPRATRSCAPPADAEDDGAPPRLIAAAPLSFPVSLLLALLARRRLRVRRRRARHPAGADTGTRSSRAAAGLPAETTSNEARLIDQVDTHISKVVELGFLRPPARPGQRYEVRRILKAYVDAQWLADFAAATARSLGDSSGTMSEPLMTPRAIRPRGRAQPASGCTAGALQLGHLRPAGLDASTSTAQQPAHRRHRLGQVDAGRRDHHAAAARQPHRLQQGGRRRDQGTQPALLRPRPLQVRAQRDHRRLPARRPARPPILLGDPRRLPQRAARRDRHPGPGVLAPRRPAGQPDRFYVVADRELVDRRGLRRLRHRHRRAATAAARGRRRRRTTTFPDYGSDFRRRARHRRPSRRWSCSTRPCR